MAKQNKYGQGGGFFLLIAAILLLAWGMLRQQGPLVSWGALPMREKNDLWDSAAGELPICEDTVCVNLNSGQQPVMVNVSIYVTARDGKREELITQLQQHDSEIQDRIRTVVGAAPAWQLKDPELTHIRQGIQDHLEAVVGRALVAKLLIPKWQVSL